MSSSWKNLLVEAMTQWTSGGPRALATDILEKTSDYAPPPRLLPLPRESGYAESFDGTRIYWEWHGPAMGPNTPAPMLFCYGLVCSMNQWRAQLERYAPTRPCILFDYRGHHRSEFPKDEARLNLSALAKDAAAVLETTKVKHPVHVWGHSLGVDVALELAAAEPDRCRSLILCCGTAQNPFKKMFGTTLIEKLMSPVLGVYPSQAEYIDLVWKALLFKPEIMELSAGLLGFNRKASVAARDIEAYARSVASIPPRTFFLLLRDLSRGMTQAILPKVKVPALAVAGSRDLVTPPAQMKALASSLPDGTYIEIPAGSHNAQLDFGEYVCLKVEQFWRGRKLDSNDSGT